MIAYMRVRYANWCVVKNVKGLLRFIDDVTIVSVLDKSALSKTMVYR